MSDKLLPIDRVAELNNVGVFILFEYFIMVELTMQEDKPTLHCLAVQSVKVRINHSNIFNHGQPIVETSILATPYDGGYGAAIHDFVLWWMYTNYGPSAVSIADRGTVKPDAARVREIYANARKGSVQAFPIDNFTQPLTKPTKDDYWTHFAHGGFDVYPKYDGKTMANTPKAYKDWAIRLTEKGYREISPACEHLLKMGEKILSFMESQLDIKTKDQLKAMQEDIMVYAQITFEMVFSDFYFEAQSQGLTLNDEKQLEWVTGKPHIAPTLDKTKKTTQKLGSYTYNPRRRTRRIR